MREAVDIDIDAIAGCLHAHHDLRVASIAQLPIGFDPNAAVFSVDTIDGQTWFLKIRSGLINEAALLVPRALIDAGVRNILAPVRTRASTLSFPTDTTGARHGILYPFITGDDVIASGLTDEQWQTFGLTLRAVHDCSIADTPRGRLPREAFDLPSAKMVRHVTETARTTRFDSPAASQLAEFWIANEDRINRMLARTESLGRSIQVKPAEMVLCHGDIHAGNIVRTPEGNIWLVDWDAPLIAPRERDLLFVIGSRIARTVEPREEELFFTGYGPVEIDPATLFYFRYERIIEDLGEFGRSVFLSAHLSEQEREFEAELAISFFAPGGDIDRAEHVSRSRWSRAG